MRLDSGLIDQVEPLLREALPAFGSDPETIGPYRVLRRLGEGGMGRVHLARREDSEVATDVAIKLIRSDRVSPGLVEKFEAERRHLAALDHPGICRFIDAARLPDGNPYVVMEAVEGEPILDYCARRGLDIGARLGLLRKLLAAVAHAHDRLLVHRDIKPQNVLVTAEGEPKLLDFGIAKSLQADAAHLTRTAERFFTPNSSAPEQLLGGAIGVGCDVYALGALAYELLSGHAPFEFEGLRAAEIERLILQVPPPPMSERAGPALKRDLRGDLDAIVSTCLRKAPAERYANVSALDADLQRFEEGRPVRARPQNWLYRSRLFVRRHRVAMALTGALAIAILGSAAALGMQALELREQRNLAVIERDRALQVVEILESAFQNADPARASGDRVTARDILDAAVPSIDALEHQQPELFARLAATLARVELDLSQGVRASNWAERGIKAGNTADVPEEILVSLLFTGSMAMARHGDAAAAEVYLQQLGELLPKTRLEYRLAEARIFVARSRFQDAVAILDSAIKAADAEGLGADSALAIELRWLFSVALGRTGKRPQAIEMLRGVLAWQLETLPESHPWTVRTRLQVLTELSNHSPSQSVAEQLVNEIKQLRSQHGEANSSVALASAVYASTLVGMGELESAVVEYQKALPILRESLGDENVLFIRHSLNFSTALYGIGTESSLRTARQILEEMYGTTRRLYPRLSPITLHAQSRLARASMKLGDWSSALAILTHSDYSDAHTSPSAPDLRNQLRALDMALEGPLCSEGGALHVEACLVVSERILKIEEVLESAGLRVR